LFALLLLLLLLLLPPPLPPTTVKAKGRENTEKGRGRREKEE
jgi:hypothetical protein